MVPAIGSRNRDEMYGGGDGTPYHPWISLISMDKRAPSMDGHAHQWYATQMARFLEWEQRTNRALSQVFYRHDNRSVDTKLMQIAYKVKLIERAGREVGLYLCHRLSLVASILSLFFNIYTPQSRQILLNNYSVLQTNMASLSFNAIKLVTAVQEDSTLQTPVPHLNYPVECDHCGGEKPNGNKCPHCGKT